MMLRVKVVTMVEQLDRKAIVYKDCPCSIVFSLPPDTI